MKNTGNGQLSDGVCFKQKILNFNLKYFKYKIILLKELIF